MKLEQIGLIILAATMVANICSIYFAARSRSYMEKAWDAQTHANEVQEKINKLLDERIRQLEQRV